MVTVVSDTSPQQTSTCDRPVCQTSTYQRISAHEETMLFLEKRSIAIYTKQIKELLLNRLYTLRSRVIYVIGVAG
jgi:hypothetical protein